jgi:cobalt-zinc-cadmium resistance protein CzcA
MDKIFEKFKSPVAVILLLILVGGMVSYKSMKTSLFPNVTFPKIKIIADNGEQPVDKMMVTVTKPLENAIKRVENIRVIRSITSMGSCEISAFMAWGSDIDLDKQQVESRISQIKNQLPPDVNITVEKMNPSILPVMGYSMQSDTKDLVELKMLAEYVVKPYLSRIEGVASVDVIGGKTKEYRVVVDESKLRTLKISTQDIARAVEQTDFITSDGFTVDFNRLYLTVTDARVKSKEELENLVVFNDAFRRIRIRDIATVEVAERNEYIRIKADGRDVPLVAVLKQPNSNLIDVSDQVQKKVEELGSILPGDVTLVPYYNQAEFVNDSIRSIIDVLWIGLILSIVVVIIFLRSLKSSTVILVTIPLTLSLTFIILKAIGFDFNIMTIGAIAASIGLIIDDSIIVVEQIHRMHEEYPDRKPGELVTKATKFLFPALVSSSLSTIVILIPFELMSGVAGAYFKILTQAMMITLLSSFVIAWLGLPVVYLLLSRKNTRVARPHPVKPTRRWLEFFIARPYVSILIALLLILGIWLVVPKMETGFLPQMDEGSIVLDFNSPPGTSLEETDRMLSEVDRIIESVPEVKTYSRRTGTQMGFFITEPSRGDYLIELYKSRTRSTEQVSDEIRRKVESAVPALIVDFGQVITDMLGDLMSSAQPIEIKIFGDDHEKIKELSRQVADRIETINGLEDVFDGVVVSGPVLKILPKEDKLHQFGLSAADLDAQVRTCIEGTVVGAILEKEQLTDVRLIYPMNNNTPIEKIRQLRIAIPSGDYLPIHEFATFDIEAGVAEIARENLQTMGVITARLHNRDLGSAMKEIRSAMADISLPPAYQVSYGGAYAEQQQSFSELLRILIAAGMLVFAVVLFMFRKVKISFIVIFISLLGIAGSLWALYLTGTPLNVGSYTGLIMIIGIIGENSIFTIQQFFSELKISGVDKALAFAISTRLRPKLMTATGAIAALMPLAFGIGTGAQMHQPLAIAVIGGLVIALPLLLVVLPGLLKLAIRKKDVA